MKKTMIRGSALILGAITLTGCIQIKYDLSKEPAFVAKEFETFENNKTSMFNASHGWSNGEPFAVTWDQKNVGYADGKMSLEISKSSDKLLGGELKSKDTFKYGFFSTKMKPMKVDGTATSFFTYTGPSEDNPWDEIDIEFLGKDTTKVQFNYFKNGKGGHEYMYNLGFDASEEYHEYGFRWAEDSIVWYVDNKPVYKVIEDIPNTESRIIMNAWTGTSEAEGWMGKLPSDFTSGKSYYEEVKYADLEGNGFELPEPEPEPGEITWTAFDPTFATAEKYIVEDGENVTNVTYEGVEPNTYKNINSLLPTDAANHNYFKAKFKNNGTATSDLRVDINTPESETHGPNNIRAINVEATCDGVPVNTDTSWGGSFFAVDAGKEVELIVKYEGNASEIMIMIDSHIAYEGTRSGNLTIKEFYLGKSNGSDEPDPEPGDGTPFTHAFNNPKPEKYTVTNENGIMTVDYKNVERRTYEVFTSSTNNQLLDKSIFEFRIKNNTETGLKFKVDLIDSSKESEGAAAANCSRKATFNGVEFPTDLANGGSTLDLGGNAEGIISVSFEEKPDIVNLMFDSLWAEDSDVGVYSGNVSLSEFVSK